jgi:hypothetical protein
MENFSKAIHLVFQRWTALQMCVEHSEVSNPQLEMEAFIQETIEFFQKYKGNVTPEDLNSNFHQWLEQVFGVAVEDDSPLQVGKHCCSLFHQIVDLGDLSPLKELEASMAAVKHRQAQSQIQEPEEGSDQDSDDSDMDVDKPVETRHKPEKVIDNDGYELVQRRR